MFKKLILLMPAMVLLLGCGDNTSTTASDANPVVQQTYMAHGNYVAKKPAGFGPSAEMLAEKVNIMSNVGYKSASMARVKSCLL